MAWGRRIIIFPFVAFFVLVTITYSSFALNSENKNAEGGLKLGQKPESPFVFVYGEDGTLTYDALDVATENDLFAFSFVDDFGGLQEFAITPDSTKKFDEFLMNKTFLREEGYLSEDEKVHVIIELEVEKEKEEAESAGTPFATGFYPPEQQEAKEKEPNKLEREIKFQEAKSEVSAILENAAEDKKGKVKDELKIVNSISAEIPLDKLKDLNGSSSIKKVYLDRKVEIVVQDSVPLINATKVWLLNDSQGRNVTGRGVSIAIIDTGVDYTHPDLGGCFGSGCKVVGGYDFVNNDADPMDDHGHGTHVAATAASNRTLKGVAPDADVYAYKVLSSGGWGYWSWVISGIERATDPNNDGNYSDHVDIISMSLGGSGNEDDVVAKAVDTAVDSGVVAVVAAGNSGTMSNAIGTPASARKAITVAATDKSDMLAWFSSRGPTPKNNLKPDLAAPGVSICAAQWNSWLDSGHCYDNRHISISGTSMATPHVSGAAALLLQLNPTWGPDQVKSALVSTAKDLGYTAFEQGSGRMDVYNASQVLLVTYPAVISFGQISLKNATQQMVIQNLNSGGLGLNITAGLMRDSSKNTYNVSYIVNATNATQNLTSFTIPSGKNATVNLTVNLSSGAEGTLYGYIEISHNGTYYRVPYSLVRLTSVAVRVVDASGNALSPYFITIHNESLTYIRWGSWYELSDGQFTFNVPSGSYTLHAIGDSSNRSLTYVLSRNISATLGTTNSYNLSLGDAKKFNVSARSLDNKILDLNKWYYILNEKSGWTSFSVSVLHIGTVFQGDREVYLLMDNDTIMTNISLSYIGYPQRNNSFSETQWTWDQESFDAAEEVYLGGWILTNLSATESNTILNFTVNDLATYNISYHYPGSAPHLAVNSYSNAYNGILFWISPSAWLDMSLWHKFSAGTNKTFYVRGNAEWGFWPYVYISYAPDSDSFMEFVKATVQQEQPTGISTYWPLGFRAKGNDSREISFGRAPYLAASFDNKATAVNISDYPLKNYNNNSYVLKSLTYYYSNGVWNLLELAPLVLTIYDSNGNMIYNQTKPWTGISEVPLSSGQYKANLTIEGKYPVFNTTVVTAVFDLSQSDTDPPILSAANFPQYFELNKNYSLSVNFTDANGLSNVSAYYSIDLVGWMQLGLSNSTANRFSADVNMTNSSAERLYLKITANDTANNRINFTFYPVALKARGVNLNFVASKTSASQGDQIIFTGRAIDTVTGGAIPGLRIQYVLDNAKQGYDRTEFTSTSLYNSYKGWHTLQQGEFETAWSIPSDYSGAAASFSAVLNGTGIYLRNTTTISISVSQPSPVYSNIVLHPAHPDANDTIQINSTWVSTLYALGTVLFESNYSGTLTNYTTSSYGSVYNYTISGFLPAGRIVSYRFLANNSQARWGDTGTTAFTILNVSANLSAGQTELSVQTNNNNSLWCDYAEIGGSDIRGATVYAEIDSANNTMSYNTTTARYEYQYNASGSTGIKTWKCFASRTDYETKSTTSQFAVLAETTIPSYSNVGRTADPIYNYNDVDLNATWTNNAGLSAIILTSNFSGSWRNYTVATNPSMPYIASFTIKSGNLSSGQVVSWHYIANDTSANWNTFMPAQSFTVANRVPQVSFTADNNKGWGESWTFKCNITDLDGDKVDATLYSSANTTGTWVNETTNSSSANNSTQEIVFNSKFFTTDYIGVSRVKCSATDSKSAANETSNVTINVEKDEVNVTLTHGFNKTVQRYRLNSITLEATFYDFDKGEYINNTNASIRVTKGGNTSYTVTLFCVSNSSGNCSSSLDPDDTYTAGLQYFIAGIDDFNLHYKAVNSSQSNFSVKGQLFTSVDSPSGAFNESQIIYLNTTVSDDTSNTVTAGEVAFEYKNSKVAPWSKCTSVNESTQGRYFCALDTSQLQFGFYDISYTATKANYTDSNTTVFHQFLIIRIVRFENYFNTTANEKVPLNSSDMNASFEIYANRSLTNVLLNVTFNSTNPTNSPLAVLELGKYFDINASYELATNLSHMVFKVNYTIAELNASGASEDSLRIYRFNGTDWVAFDQPFGGVNKTDRYVWANLTNFSNYAVGGKKNNGVACTSSTECDSSNCAIDFDGIGRWCAPANSCVHDYDIAYANGNTTCAGNSSLMTCSSGSWSGQTCSAGCSAGACLAAATTATVSSGSSGGGVIPSFLSKVSKAKATTTTQTPQSENVLANVEFKTAVEKILGKLDEKTTTKLSAVTSEVAKHISAPSRAVTIDNGKSTLSLRMKYSGTESLKNFFVYDTVPKAFAESASQITIIAPGSIVTLVKDDPVYLLQYSPLRIGQEININYTVTKAVDMNKTLDETPSPIFLAEKFEDRPEVAEAITPEAKKPAMRVIILYVAFGVIAVLAAVIFKLKSGKHKSLQKK